MSDMQCISALFNVPTTKSTTEYVIHVSQFVYMCFLFVCLFICLCGYVVVCVCVYVCVCGVGLCVCVLEAKINY